MHTFLSDHRDELIERCKAKVSMRPTPVATAEQLAHGIPLFLDQLIRTLRAEDEGDAAAVLRISGPAGGGESASEIGGGAATHGRELLRLGFSIKQVVHDYGDLCQSITDLAIDVRAPFSVEAYRTLNRCLDNAIADAVMAFSGQRDVDNARQQSADGNERLGVLVHEVRNFLNTATLAFAALESGQLAVGGSTAGVLKRSLAAMSTLLAGSLDEVRVKAGSHAQQEVFAVGAFIAEARNSAAFDATQQGCSLLVEPVESRLRVQGNRELLLAALINVLQNAFKFTRKHGEVTMTATRLGSRVLVSVQDQCGGLPPGNMEGLFRPFTQAGDNKSGLGLGLFIARRYVEASGGLLTARNLAGIGCVITIELPLRELP